MPSLETDCRLQKAVLWEASTTEYEDTGATRKVAAAVEIDVRWEDTHREGMDPDGNVVAIVSEVVVAQDIVVGSIMWLGSKADLEDPPVGLHKVMGFVKVPDIKGRNYRRVVSLMRYSNSLPTLVS